MHIRMRGNHENYGFLVYYFNKYLPRITKQYLLHDWKTKDTVFASSHLVVEGIWLHCLYQRALQINIKIKPG